MIQSYRIDHLFTRTWGGITEGFEFQMDEDTEVYESCSAQLNGELFVFGGVNGDKQKQVYLLNYRTCKPV